MAIAEYAEQHTPESSLETFNFTLIFAGVDTISDELEKAIYGGKCDDALLGMTEGQLFLTFDRQAPSLVEAIMSAISDVEATSLGLRVIEVVPPGERIISIFNALLKLRNDTSEAELIAGSSFGKLLVEAFRNPAAR